MSVLVRRRVWRTHAGTLVPDGHPDAAFLAYSPGTAVPDLVAARVGLTAELAADPARTHEVTPTVVVPAPTANLSGTTVIPDPVAVRDASVDGVAVVASDELDEPNRIVEGKPNRTTRKV